MRSVCAYLTIAVLAMLLGTATIYAVDAVAGCNSQACEKRVAKKAAWNKRAPGCSTRSCAQRVCRSAGCRRRVAARRYGALTPPGKAWLDRLAACESGGNYRAVSPSGQYRGRYQFDYRTWGSVGGSGDPAAASPAEQDYRASLLYQRRGAQPWPVCG